MALGMNGGVFERKRDNKSEGWYARKKIADDLREIIGKTEFQQKLPNARTRAQATREAIPIHASWDATLNLARKGEYPPLNAEAFEVLAHDFWRWIDESYAKQVGQEHDSIEAWFLENRRRIREALIKFAVVRGLRLSEGGLNFTGLLAEIELHLPIAVVRHHSARVAHPMTGSVVTQTITRSGNSYRFDSLIGHWAKERKKPERTVYQWGRIVAKFTKFIDDDDITRITEEDCARWKDDLVQNGNLHARTIKNHLLVVNTLLNHAVANRTTTGVYENHMRVICASVKASKKKNRHPGFTDEQARLILLAARKQQEHYQTQRRTGIRKRPTPISIRSNK